jgi:quinol monooxygenase YgiN
VEPGPEAHPDPEPSCCPIIELRDYTLHPGQRETLIDLFDRELVETQEAVGIRVVGQFRDLDRPDHFVWIRGFSSMAARAEALATFYGGPIWKAHREVANATMIDSSNVLLLAPVEPGEGFRRSGVLRPPRDATDRPASLCVATVCAFDGPVGDGFLRFFDQTVRPALEATGDAIEATLRTEPSENTFPALPVREGENVFVWFSVFSSVAAHASHLAGLGRARGWQEIGPALRSWLAAPPQVFRLAPTARSAFPTPPRIR